MKGGDDDQNDHAKRDTCIYMPCIGRERHKRHAERISEHSMPVSSLGIREKEAGGE